MITLTEQFRAKFILAWTSVVVVALIAYLGKPPLLHHDPLGISRTCMYALA